MMFNSQILKLIQIYESLLTPVGPVRTVQLLTNINVCPNTVSFNKAAGDAVIQVWSWSEIRIWLQPVS